MLLLSMVTLLVFAIPARTGMGSGENPYAGLAAMGPFLDLLYIVFCFIAVPMFANWIYYRHTKSKVARISSEFSSDTQRSNELMRIGGASVAAPIVVSILVPLLAAVLIALIVGAIT